MLSSRRAMRWGILEVGPSITTAHISQLNSGPLCPILLVGSGQGSSTKNLYTGPHPHQLAADIPKGGRGGQSKVRLEEGGDSEEERRTEKDSGGWPHQSPDQISWMVHANTAEGV